MALERTRKSVQPLGVVVRRLPYFFSDPACATSLGKSFKRGAKVLKLRRRKPGPAQKKPCLSSREGWKGDHDVELQVACVLGQCLEAAFELEKDLLREGGVPAEVGNIGNALGIAGAS